VDDWEQFFREKSARRAKRERLRRLIPAIVWTAAVGAAAAGLIAAVSAVQVIGLSFRPG
jgi:anti-sigma factor RsiW